MKIGDKIGRLTIININEEESNKRRGKRGSKRKYWNCVCECGNKCVVRNDLLKEGRVRSCGCLQKEIQSERLKNQWKDEEYRNKMEQLLNSEEMKTNSSKRLSERLKNQWKDEEYRQKQSEQRTKLNYKMWENEELKRKASEQMKERWQDDEFRQVRSEASSKQLKGKWQDEEFRVARTNYAREQMKERWQNEEYREAHSGKNSHFYNQDLTDEDRKLLEERRQGNSEFNRWSYEVKERANFTCDCCGDNRGGNLVSHHLNDWHTYKEQRYDLDNGVCLCDKCHKEFHKWMGNNRVSCTKEDYYTFKNKGEI